MIIKDPITILTMPFYLKKGCRMPLLEDSYGSKVWVPAVFKYDKSNLYAHINKLLFHSMDEKDPSKLYDTDYRIWVLNIPDNATKIVEKNNSSRPANIEIKQKPLNLRNFFEEEMVMMRKEKGDRENTLSEVIKFRFIAESGRNMLRPMLIFCEKAEVGMFVIPLQSGEGLEYSEKLDDKSKKRQKSKTTHTKSSIEDVIDLNYGLIKEGQGYNIYCATDWEEASKEKQNTNDKVESYDYNDYERELFSTIGKTYIREEIINGLKKKKSNVKKKSEDEITISEEEINKELGEKYPMGPYWEMFELLDYMKSPIDTAIELFDEKRMHPFTLINCILEESDDMENGISSCLIEDFTRIIRGQNRNYKVLPDVTDGQVLKQTFENIYIGASVEGGGIMLVDDPSVKTKNEFFKNFPTSSFKCYLWIYLMGLMQRHTLLNLVSFMADSDDNMEKKSVNYRLNKLRDVSEKLTANRLNTFFTEISDHTQHNTFYHLLCKNLGIDRLNSEIDVKLRNLSKQAIDLAGEQNENTTFIITFVVGLFAIASFVSDSLQFLQNTGIVCKERPSISVVIIYFVLIAILLIIFIYLLNRYFSLLDRIRKRSVYIKLKNFLQIARARVKQFCNTNKK